MENNMEVSRLDEIGKKVLNKILTLYYGLRGGFIWRELKAEDIIIPLDRKEPVFKAEGEYYLEELLETDGEQFSNWLSDWENTALWIVTTCRGFPLPPPRCPSRAPLAERGSS